MPKDNEPKVVELDDTGPGAQVTFPEEKKEEEKDQGKRKILRQFDPIVVGKKGLSPDTAEFLSVFFQQRKTPGQRIPQKLVFLSLMLQANSVTQPATAVGFQYRPVSPQLDAARIFGIVDDVECVSINLLHRWIY